MNCRRLIQCLAVLLLLVRTGGAGPTNHWAFEPIAASPPPKVIQLGWCQTPVDRFILARLEAAGGTPAPKADPGVLIRRVTFDLTGLPPAPEEVEAFTRAARRSLPSAVFELTERLMASPRYGERWGRWWLDVARYADSNGQDENKVMGNAWRYRDWVIRAFNQNKPFDQFITEQLAGDLLPPAATERETFDRWTATGFLVLGPKMLAEQDKQKLVMDIVDEQIDTVGRTFLGLTLGCARCHDHKFDPVPTRDYYAMAGIFKSTRTMEDLAFVSKFNERPVTTREELAAIAQHARRMEELTNHIEVVVRDGNVALLAEWTQDLPRYLSTAVGDGNAPTPSGLNSNVLHRLRALVAGDPKTNEVSRSLRQLASAPDRSIAFLEDLRKPSSPTNEIHKALLGPEGAFELPKEPRPFYPASTRAALAELEKAKAELQSTAPAPPASAMAVSEDKPVEVPIHLRGSHLQLAPDPIPRGFLRVLARPGLPSAVPAEQSGRLELARWLTDRENPLTARVIVNRIWQAHFGEGLVRTSDNFGLKGEPPTHPELLDWLAAEFIRSGWDVKAMHRLILSSSVYQQSASTRVAVVGSTRRVSAGLPPASDPDNHLLWRFPRQRLEAEMIRDGILAISGRLDSQVGGSLVSWKNNEYVPGDEVSAKSVRRTVYLPVVRDRVFDALTLFDFANPSVCSARRTPTVVSHQALFFLNSPLVKDSAEALAEKLLARADLDEGGRLKEACLRVLNRPATRAEIARGREFLARLARDPGVGKDEGSRKREDLGAFIQTLFASNEFVYVH